MSCTSYFNCNQPLGGREMNEYNPNGRTKEVLEAAMDLSVTRVGTPAYCAPEQLGRGLRRASGRRSEDWRHL